MHKGGFVVKYSTRASALSRNRGQVLPFFYRGPAANYYADELDRVAHRRLSRHFSSKNGIITGNFPNSPNPGSGGFERKNSSRLHANPLTSNNEKQLEYLSNSISAGQFPVLSEVFTMVDESITIGDTIGAYRIIELLVNHETETDIFVPTEAFTRLLSAVGLQGADGLHISDQLIALLLRYPSKRINAHIINMYTSILAGLSPPDHVRGLAFCSIFAPIDNGLCYERYMEAVFRNHRLDGVSSFVAHITDACATRSVSSQDINSSTGDESAFPIAIHYPSSLSLLRASARLRLPNPQVLLPVVLKSFAEAHSANHSAFSSAITPNSSASELPPVQPGQLLPIFNAYLDALTASNNVEEALSFYNYGAQLGLVEGLHTRALLEKSVELLEQHGASGVQSSTTNTPDAALEALASPLQAQFPFFPITLPKTVLSHEVLLSLLPSSLVKDSVLPIVFDKIVDIIATVTPELTRNTPSVTASTAPSPDSKTELAHSEDDEVTPLMTLALLSISEVCRSLEGVIEQGQRLMSISTGVSGSTSTASADTNNSEGSVGLESSIPSKGMESVVAVSANLNNLSNVVNTRSMNKIIQKLLQKGYVDEAMLLLESMQDLRKMYADFSIRKMFNIKIIPCTPDTTSYNMLLRHAVLNGDKNTMERVIFMLKEGGISPTPETVGILQLLNHRSGRSASVSELLSTLAGSRDPSASSTSTATFPDAESPVAGMVATTAPSTVDNLFQASVQNAQSYKGLLASERREMTSETRPQGHISDTTSDAPTFSNANAEHIATLNSSTRLSPENASSTPSEQGVAASRAPNLSGNEALWNQPGLHSTLAHTSEEEVTAFVNSILQTHMQQDVHSNSYSHFRSDYSTADGFTPRNKRQNINRNRISSLLNEAASRYFALGQFQKALGILDVYESCNLPVRPDTVRTLVSGVMLGSPTSNSSPGTKTQTVPQTLQLVQEANLSPSVLPGKGLCKIFIPVKNKNYDTTSLKTLGAWLAEYRQAALGSFLAKHSKRPIGLDSVSLKPLLTAADVAQYSYSPRFPSLVQIDSSALMLTDLLQKFSLYPTNSASDSVSSSNEPLSTVEDASPTSTSSSLAKLAILPSLLTKLVSMIAQKPMPFVSNSNSANADTTSALLKPVHSPFANITPPPWFSRSPLLQAAIDANTNGNTSATDSDSDTASSSSSPPHSTPFASLDGRSTAGWDLSRHTRHNAMLLRCVAELALSLDNLLTRSVRVLPATHAFANFLALYPTGYLASRAALSSRAASLFPSMVSIDLRENSPESASLFVHALLNHIATNYALGHPTGLECTDEQKDEGQPTLKTLCLVTGHNGNMLTSRIHTLLNDELGPATPPTFVPTFRALVFPGTELQQWCDQEAQRLKRVHNARIGVKETPKSVNKTSHGVGSLKEQKQNKKQAKKEKSTSESKRSMQESASNVPISNIENRFSNLLRELQNDRT